MKIAEDFLGPEIDSAFAGIAMGQLNDGDALRPEKEQQGNEPEPNGDAAIRGDGRDDVEVKNGDDEKENQIATAWRTV